MSKKFIYFTCAAIGTLLLGGVAWAAHDVTGPGDAVQGVPNDGPSTVDTRGWPPTEIPANAIDNQVPTKFLHFKGDVEPTGLRITPKVGPTVVIGVTFTSANDTTGYPGRAPVTYELSGSNVSVDGPYTLIAKGDIKDFAGPTVWPDFTKTTTPMRFANTVAYAHYQLMFPTTWKMKYNTGDTCMQIAEIELLAADPAPYAPSPADGTIGVVYPLLQWIPGDMAAFEDVYVGTTPELTAADRLPTGTHIPASFKMAYYPKPLLSGQKYYWRVDDIDAAGNVHTGTVWSFTAAPTIAYSPKPLDGDKWIDTDVTLTWEAGQGASSHELYFGADQAAVTSRDASTFKIKQLGRSYEVTGLAENTTYYWVVDEIVGATTKAGDVWSFTTNGPGGGAKGEYFGNLTLSGLPTLTRIDPEISFNWAGNGPGAPLQGTGFSARWTADLDIAIADTYTFAITTAGCTRLWIDGALLIDRWVSWVPVTYATLPTPLSRGIHALVLEYANPDRGDAQATLFWERPGVSRVVLPAGPLQPPLRARALYPADGDVNVPQDVTLLWSAGEKAETHDLYFGDDANAVAAADTSSSLYKGNQAEASFDLIALEWNKTYYWRVDEVNEVEAGSPWKAGTWSFTTADFLVVDNFESYNDEEGMDTRIYETWIDGLTNSTSSTVGYWDPPFAEPTIVHGGGQSMPLDYNNINSPYYSEAEREFSPVQNWTVNGITDLVLFLRGNPVSFMENPPGQYTISANSGDVWGAADTFRYVYKTLNGDGSISAKVISATHTADWAKTGVMIRDTLDPASAYAFMFPTPNGIRAFQNRTATGAGAISAHSGSGQAALPFWVKVERKANTFTGYYSVDGKNWIKQPDTENTGGDASTNPQTITMGGNVLIGLAVSSNNGQAGACTAVFSDVVITGSVGAQFKVAAVGTIGISNDPAPLYVTLQDSANKTAVVANPDPAAVNVADWTEWRIPLSSFSGVNPAKIKKMVIGVGDRTNAVPDGHGLLFIDDIRVVKP